MKITSLCTITALMFISILMFGCAADVKQRQSITDAGGIVAEGGLPNLSKLTSDKAETGLNYPATSVVSNKEQFGTAGPGSQTTLFNQSFGTAMVAGVLKASKVHAVTQENDDITIEGLEIDNSANAASVWAKAIETQVMQMSQDQREIAKAQLQAQADAIKATAPLAAQLIQALAAGL